MNIVLTGFMGTGKSEVGKLLAAKLGWQFFDTDSMIEHDTGLTIAKIFAQKGEPHFRELESKAVALLSMLDNAVISCGGGVVLKDANMDELEKNGVIVCLTARPEVIFQRVKNDASRPLLKAKDPLEKIRQLLDERVPQYRRCHATIDTSDIGTDDVVEKILGEPAVATKLGG